jgi:hypothetical protein
MRFFFLQKNIRNLPVILDFTLRVITRNVTVSYRNVTGLYNPSWLLFIRGKV